MSVGLAFGLALPPNAWQGTDWESRMSVEDLQNWVKRQQELPQKPMGKLRYEWEVLKTKLELEWVRFRQLRTRENEWAAKFDPTLRKDHVPFSKGIVNEFAAMIGRLIGRVLFVILFVLIAYWFGLFNR